MGFEGSLVNIHIPLEPAEIATLRLEGSGTAPGCALGKLPPPPISPLQLTHKAIMCRGPLSEAKQQRFVGNFRMEPGAPSSSAPRISRFFRTQNARGGAWPRLPLPPVRPPSSSPWRPRWRCPGPPTWPGPQIWGVDPQGTGFICAVPFWINPHTSTDGPISRGRDDTHSIKRSFIDSINHINTMG